jgi:hypothetical protein
MDSLLAGNLAGNFAIFRHPGDVRSKFMKKLQYVAPDSLPDRSRESICLEQGFFRRSRE